ncbi:MAG: TlpA family protein disulfide reductase [Bacteroidetes bacterium]|nr:TlpA family protein disulfide reductase [Bacteroidota bacterium]
MNKITAVFISLLISVFSQAQSVIIKGTAKAYEYQEISAWLNNDHITNNQKQLTYSTVDSLGNFLLEFNCKEIQYITLKVDKNISSMYVEPQGSYEVIFMPPDSTTYQNPNIEHDVKLSIKLKSKTEINALTIDFDERFDYFLTADYISFLKRTPQAKIDSFKLAMNEFYSTVKNPYFKSYMTYAIASLEQKTKMSEKKLFEQYIAGKPVLYGNPEYMNFFNDFFKQKLLDFSMSKDGGPMAFQINDRGSFTGAMDVLKRDAFLQNDTLRELVLIKGLFESYYDNSFKRPAIVAMLEQAAVDSKISEHKRISQNILSSFSRLKPGAPAPYFELPDKAGLTHSITEIAEKKYVYLMFYSSTCTACMQQMKIIPSLIKTYGDRIAFVSISTDKTNAELKNFQLKNPKYNWFFLYDNSNGKLKKDFEIRALPAYFLIGPNGNFIQVPAESPDEDISRAFYDLTKPKVKTHGVGDKKNK